MSDSKERSGGGTGSGTIVSENGFGPRLKRSKAFLICKEAPCVWGRRMRRLLVQKRKSKAASEVGTRLAEVDSFFHAHTHANDSRMGSRNEEVEFADVEAPAFLELP
jgi:hypothetical protein